MTDEWLINGLPISDEWVPVPPGTPPNVTSIVDNLTLTGDPGTITGDVVFADAVIFDDVVTLAGDPTEALQPATKQYVDAHSGTGVTVPSTPINVAPPLSIGTGVVGQVLACTVGAWNGSPTLFSYSWLKDGVSNGATGNTYTLLSGDATHSISCLVTAANLLGSASAQSNAIAVAAGGTLAPINVSAPTISGAGTTGTSLIISSNGSWSNSPTSFSYQWYRGGSAISDGTGAAPSYTVVSADLGFSLACMVTAANSVGFGSAISNAIVAGAGLAAPVNTALPTLSGLNYVGQTLSCSLGTWSGVPTSYNQQWLRDGSPISGATGGSYLLASADIAHSISCQVTAHNASGSGIATSSSILATVTPPTNISLPSCTGLPTPGNVLHTSNGSWTGTPTSYAYQWLRDGSNISGQTTANYTIVSGDIGHTISCRVTASNAGGPGSPAISNSISPASPMILPAGAAAAYSLRNIVSGYAGFCLAVRRSSDGGTQNIGFTSSGDVDIASALAFAGGSIMTVAAWYDQSGNSLNLGQTDANHSPQLLSIGGQPWIAFGDSFLHTGSVALTLTGNQTIGVVAQLNSDISQFPITANDTTNGWSLFFNGLLAGGGDPGVGANPGKTVYYTQGGGQIVGSGNLFASMPARVVATRASGTVTLYHNGSTDGSGAGSNAATSEPFTIGQNSHATTNNFFYFEGLIGEVFLYSSALTTGQLSAIDTAQAAYWGDTGFTTPSNGVASVQFGHGEAITLGNVLNYERTQPWTIFSAFQAYSSAAQGLGSAMCIFTNVPAAGPAFPGYEFWIDSNGHSRVRIMHDIGAGNYIGVIGTTNIADGFKHVIAATYDGSSTAAGVKIYVDGFLESVTVESDTLTASIIGSGQSLYVGTQQAQPYFNLRGCLGRFQVDHVARSAGYVSTYNSPSNLPPVDGNTALCLELTEGGGTVAHDSSGNGLNGTLSHSSMWVM